MTDPKQKMSHWVWTPYALEGFTSAYHLERIQRRQRVELFPSGNVLGPRHQSVLWRLQGVLHAVVHGKHVGSRPRRNIAVRSVHGVAVEEDDRTGTRRHGFDAALIHQQLEAAFASYQAYP